MAKVVVRIQNPMPNGRPEMTLSKARSVVRRRRAVWVVEPVLIRFLEDAERRALVARVVESQEQKLHARVTGCGYDRLRGDYRRNAIHIPVIHAEKML